MSKKVKYAAYHVSVHGLDAEPEALEFLRGRLHAAAKDCLLNSTRSKAFGFRDDFADDLEVELIETAPPAEDTDNEPSQA